MSLFTEYMNRQPKTQDRLDMAEVFGGGWAVGTERERWMRSWKSKTLKFPLRVVYLLGRRGDLPGCASVVLLKADGIREARWDILWYDRPPSVVEAQLLAGPCPFDSMRSDVGTTVGAIGRALMNLQAHSEAGPIPEDPPIAWTST